MAVAVTRTGLDAVGLRRPAARSKDADAARRVLAPALVLDGSSRTAAAGQCGMGRQTLRDWVHRRNGLGTDGPVEGAPRLQAASVAGAGGRSGGVGP